jgi:hypothetical protein
MREFLKLQRCLGPRAAFALRGGCRIKPFRKRRCVLAEVGARAVERRDVVTGRWRVTDDLPRFGAHP